MAVDLTTLVEPLKSEVSPPGTDLYPTAENEDWLKRLRSSFWDVRLYGMLEGFELDAASRGGDESFGENIITPLRAVVGYDDGGFSTTKDLSRDLQQLIVLWAAWNTTLTEMKKSASLFKAKAGPVEFERQQAATVLTEVLKAMKEKLNFILENLSKIGFSGALVLDAYANRTYGQCIGEVAWLR